MTLRERRQFRREIKRVAVSRVESGESVQAVAKDLQIPEPVLREWVLKKMAVPTPPQTASEARQVSTPGNPKEVYLLKQPTSADVIVGQNIRRFRNRKGLSQSQLAQDLHISFQQIQK